MRKLVNHKSLFAACAIVLVGASVPVGLASAQTRPKCAGTPATIVGTAGNDVLEGTDADDVIVGLGGNDTIIGGGGDDLICAGSGNDTVHGGNGADVIRGGTGDDYLGGDGGEDFLYGGSGADVMRGDEPYSQEPNADFLDGGTGDDSLYGGAGPDKMMGRQGSDFMVGNMGRDKIYGGSGDDSISGLGGRDQIRGGAGNDVLLGGSHADRLNGGKDLDTCASAGVANNCEVKPSFYVVPVRFKAIPKQLDPNEPVNDDFLAGAYVTVRTPAFNNLPFRERFLGSRSVFSVETIDPLASTVEIEKRFGNETPRFAYGTVTAPGLPDEPVDVVVECCTTRSKLQTRPTS